MTDWPVHATITGPIVMIGFGFCIMNVDSIAAAIIQNWFT